MSAITENYYTTWKLPHSVFRVKWALGRVGHAEPVLDTLNSRRTPQNARFHVIDYRKLLHSVFRAKCTLGTHLPRI